MNPDLSLSRHHALSDKLAYDRLEMGKHNAWNINSVVAPKLVGLNSLSMTTKGQMKPTGNFRGELNGIPGLRDQPKQCP